MDNKNRNMGFTNWNCSNTQSNDPYALEVKDYESYITKKNTMHKPKSSNRYVSAVCKRYPKKCIAGSLWYVSKAASSQINAQNIYKQRKRVQLAKTTYKFFKSRSIEINSKYASQEHDNTHLADIASDKIESFTLQSIEISSLSPRNLSIKRSVINTPPIKEVVTSKEENLFLFVPRILPHTNNKKELIPPVTEDYNFSHQNSQTSSQMVSFHINRENNKSSAKPLKFFKSRNGNAISDFTFRNCTGEKRCSFSCIPQNRKSTGVQERPPGDDFASMSESQPRNPYSLEMEDSNYSNTQNKNVKFAAIGNRSSYLKSIQQDDKGSSVKKHVPRNDLPLSSESRSKYPSSFERAIDDALKNKLKSKKCIETSSTVLSTESWACHHESLCNTHKQKCMQSLNTAKHIPSKQCFTSSKTKAFNQPVIDKLITQPKEANAKITMHQTIVEPAKDPTFYKSMNENMHRTLHDKRSHQIELDHLSSTLLHKGKNIHIKSSQKKCSIGYFYEIKNALSAATLRRGTNTESFQKEDKERHDLRSTSATIPGKIDNITNKTDEANNIPRIRCLADLKTHTVYAKKNQPKVTSITDNNEQLLLSSLGDYMVCNKNKTVAREFFTQETDSTSLDANDVTSSKEEKSSRMPLGKESIFTHNENVPNHSKDDFDLLFRTDEIENCFKQTTEDFHLNILSEEAVATSKASSKTPGLLDLCANKTNHTNAFAHRKQRMKDKVKCKDTRGKYVNKQQANYTSKQRQKTSRFQTRRSARHDVNNITNKASLLKMKTSTRCKKTYVKNVHKEDKQKYDLHLASARMLNETENVSNKTDASTRGLAGLNILSKCSKEEQPKVTRTTDHNEPLLFRKCSLGTYRNITIEPSRKCRIQETGTPSLDASGVRSTKEVKSSCMSIAKDFSSEIKTTCNENDSRNDFDLLFGSNEIKHCFKQTNQDVHLNILSEDKVTASKASSKTPGLRDPIVNMLKRANQYCVPKNQRMKAKVKSKDSSGENVIKHRKKNPIPKLRQKTPRSKCTSRETKNYITNKESSAMVKRGNSFKKQIFISKKRKGTVLYKHMWIDNTETKQDTGLTSPAKLLVQPIGIAKPGHVEELVCVGSGHSQSVAFANKAEAAMHLKRNELDKKDLKILRNVRKSEHIQELGELQEFNDDIEYMLDALQDSNPVAIRCQSALILASKCFIPAFRSRIGTYEALEKCFNALHDAVNDQSLALCTATVMFVLSPYQLNTHLNYNSTKLLLSLLNADLISGAQSRQLHSIKKKALELCCKVPGFEHAMYLNLENITANLLAAEALLSLTRCDATHLFEDDLSRMEGLKHIIKAISACKTEVASIAIEWEEPVLDKLKFLSCCMQVLEHITDQNEGIQLEVLKDGDFIETMAALFAKCAEEIRNMSYSTDVDAASTVTVEVLLAILKILNSLTHRAKKASFGSFLVVTRPDIINTSLYMLLQASQRMPERNKFDALALVLMFLINAVEHNTYNRKLIFEARVSEDKHIMEALIEFFYHQEKLARIEEYKTNAMLDDKIDSAPSYESPESSQKFIGTLEENAGHNMEYTMIASYLVLLIGHLIADNKEYELYVCQCLRQKSFSVMISVLEKMYNFLNLVPSISSKQDIEQTQRVIQYLKQLDEKALEAT